VSPGALARWWREVDRVALAAIAGLLAAGLLCSLASSPAAAARLGIDDPFYFIKRHAVFASAAMAVTLAASMLEPLRARRLAVLAFVIMLVLVAATLFAGTEVNAARRWLRFAGFSVQPSEFAKPAFIVTTAWLLAAGRTSGATAGAAGAAAGSFAIFAALLLAQPDFGQTMLIALVFAGLAFLAGAPWRLLGAGALGMAAIAGGAALALPHVLVRIRTFLSAEVGYQTGQALEAIRRGGLFGVGPGEGLVKRTLPDAHTDFIFAVASEEFGLVFTLGLVGLIATLVLRVLLRARRLEPDGPRSASALAAGGLALMIGLQALINVAVNLNLAPPKGMTLPFVSYGGSSLLALGLSGGLALAFTRRPAPEAAATAADDDAAAFERPPALAAKPLRRQTPRRAAPRVSSSPRSL
jgi:cell division protein FtsW